MNPEVLKDKIPPHNVDAELATLGALLLDSESISTVLQFLRPDDFYKGNHKKIFNAILVLFNKGESVDLLTLAQALREENLLKEAGGSAYISKLTSQVPTSANVEYYAKIVKSCAIRRNLLRIADGIISEAHDESKDSRLIVEESERKIFEITDEQHGGKYQSARELVPKTIEAIEKLYHTKETFSGIPSGFHDLDYLMSGFQNSEFIVIGARPSIGKTAFALSVASNIAVKQKIPVGFFTLEMSSMQLMLRLVSMEARLSSTLIRTGMLRSSDFHNLTEAAGRLYEAPLFIEDTPNMKLLDLRAQARRLKAQEDIKILFIDYIGLIGAENTAIPRHEQIAEISRSLKSLSRELDIPIVTLSQVGRQTEGKAPNLADLRESGSIEQDADVVMFLHRERATSNDNDKSQDAIATELILAKQRNGPTANMEIAFIAKYTKFEALSKESS